MHHARFGKLGTIAALRAFERRVAEDATVIAALRAENAALRQELAALRDSLRREVARLAPVISAWTASGPVPEMRDDTGVASSHHR